MPLDLQVLTADRDRSFGRDRRLLTRRDFQRVFERPHRSADRCFLVLARARRAGAGCANGARLGIAVGKKHVRRANRRNRLKRTVRESFRLNRERLAGLDLVVVAQAPADRQPGPALRASLERHWEEQAKRCEPPS